MRKIAGRIVAAVVVTALVLSGIHIMNYMLVDDTKPFTRLMMHEFYNQENIDILLLGASHCYRGVDPAILSEKTGKNVFAASSAKQAPDASYALLKDAVRQYDVETVYLEVSETIARASVDRAKRTELKSTYLISDYMKPSLNKLSFLLGASSPRYYINSFIPARRDWQSILDFKRTGSLLEKKASDIYRNYAYDYATKKHIWYTGNGHVACDIGTAEHGFYKEVGYKYDAVEPEAISEDWKKAVVKIVDYCNEHNIRIILYDTPISYFILSSIGNFDEYIEFIRDLVKDKNVEFAEFNLLKDEYMPYKQTNYENDGHHLNMYGAEDFSNFFADYMNGNIPDSAYYTSVSEKLAELTPDYYGVAYTDNKKENMREIRMVSNVPDYYEYKVEITKEDGTASLLQDFDVNNEIRFSRDMMTAAADGFQPRLVVTFRQKGSGDSGTRIEY